MKESGLQLFHIYFSLAAVARGPHLQFSANAGERVP